MNIGAFAGWYRLKTFKRSGLLVEDTGWFPNLITDTGMNLIGAGHSNALRFCSVGSGTAAPAFTDTSLQTYIAHTDNDVANTLGVGGSSPNFYTHITRTYEFAAGAAAGNISEVGVGVTTLGNSLQSRALVLDGGGSPTTITVLADEILQVTYQFRQYSPASDAVDTATIAGASRQFTARAARAGSNSWRVFNIQSSTTWNFGISSAGCIAYTGTIGTITQVPSGTQSNSDSASASGYTSGSFKRDFSVVWGLTKANFDIKSFLLVSTGFPRFEFQVELDTVVSKSDTQELTMNFETSWARL